MAKRMILDPPKPPAPRWPLTIEVPVGRTGVTIRVSPNGGGGVIVYRDRDRSHTTAFGQLTAAQLETLSYQLAEAVGATR